MNSNELSIILVFEPDRAEELISKILVGQKVKAFGKDSSGYWGESEKELTFEIEKAEVDHVDEDFYSMNVYLKGYSSSKPYGLIYTDDKFLKHIKRLLPSIYVTYSEQGMQGDNFVNFDLTIGKK